MIDKNALPGDFMAWLTENGVQFTGLYAWPIELPLRATIDLDKLKDAIDQKVQEAKLQARREMLEEMKTLLDGDAILYTP